jgi:nucleotide-binding universal stress UspA family protein
MNNVNKLLIPIDFSAESEKALRYASSVAKQINAELIALHVIENPTAEQSVLSLIYPPEGWPFFDENPAVRPLDTLLRERALDLWNFIDRIIPDKSSAKIKRFVRLGALRDEIVAVAREEGIDLIVLELRKRLIFSGLAKRKLLKMIDTLPYPVLLAPPVADETPKRGKRLFAFYPVPKESPA